MSHFPSNGPQARPVPGSGLARLAGLGGLAAGVGGRVGRAAMAEEEFPNLSWHLDFSCFPRVPANGKESRHPALRHRNIEGMLACKAAARLDFVIKGPDFFNERVA